MQIEKQFIELIKEGEVADAVQLIKQSLTEQAGQHIGEQSFVVAEEYGMKRVDERWENDFVGTSDSRESSEELLKAIASISNSEAEAERIWQDPTQKEIDAIKYILKKWNNDLNDIYWGEEGNKWS